MFIFCHQRSIHQGEFRCLIHILNVSLLFFQGEFARGEDAEGKLQNQLLKKLLNTSKQHQQLEAVNAASAAGASGVGATSTTVAAAAGLQSRLSEVCMQVVPEVKILLKLMFADLLFCYEIWICVPITKDN